MQIKATFDGDTKRFHRFIITEGQGITGMLYIPKTMDVPKEVTVALEVEKEVRQGQRAPTAQMKGNLS